MLEEEEERFTDVEEEGGEEDRETVWVWGRLNTREGKIESRQRDMNISQ